MKNSLPLKGAEEFTPPATKKLESTKLSTDLRVNQKSILKFFVKIKFWIPLLFQVIQLPDRYLIITQNTLTAP